MRNLLFRNALARARDSCHVRPRSRNRWGLRKASNALLHPRVAGTCALTPVFHEKESPRHIQTVLRFLVEQRALRALVRPANACRKVSAAVPARDITVRKKLSWQPQVNARRAQHALIVDLAQHNHKGAFLDLVLLPGLSTFCPLRRAVVGDLLQIRGLVGCDRLCHLSWAFGKPR